MDNMVKVFTLKHSSAVPRLPMNRDMTRKMVMVTTMSWKIALGHIAPTDPSVEPIITLPSSLLGHGPTASLTFVP